MNKDIAQMVNSCEKCQVNAGAQANDYSVNFSKSAHFPMHCIGTDFRVCYLARARAMASVMLAQIEFTRANGSRSKWLTQNSTYVMVIIVHDHALLSYWNPVPIHDSYETIRSS